MEGCGGIQELTDKVARHGCVSRVLGAGRGVASLVNRSCWDLEWPFLDLSSGETESMSIAETIKLPKCLHKL